MKVSIDILAVEIIEHGLYDVRMYGEQGYDQCSYSFGLLELSLLNAFIDTPKYVADHSKH
jgi:hypothetical protein